MHCYPRTIVLHLHYNAIMEKLVEDERIEGHALGCGDDCVSVNGVAGLSHGPYLTCAWKDNSANAVTTASLLLALQLGDQVLHCNLDLSKQHSVFR